MPLQWVLADPDPRRPALVLARQILDFPEVRLTLPFMTAMPGGPVPLREFETFAGLELPLPSEVGEFFGCRVGASRASSR